MGGVAKSADLRGPEDRTWWSRGPAGPTLWCGLRFLTKLQANQHQAGTRNGERQQHGIPRIVTRLGNLARGSPGGRRLGIRRGRRLRLRRRLGLGFRRWLGLRLRRWLGLRRRPGHRISLICRRAEAHDVRLSGVVAHHVQAAVTIRTQHTRPMVIITCTSRQADSFAATQRNRAPPPLKAPFARSSCVAAVTYCCPSTAGPSPHPCL